jgi:hypothetical protein
VESMCGTKTSINHDLHYEKKMFQKFVEMDNDIFGEIIKFCPNTTFS